MTFLNKPTVINARKYTFKIHFLRERGTNDTCIRCFIYIYICIYSFLPPPFTWFHLQAHPEADGINFIYIWVKLKLMGPETEAHKTDKWQTTICTQIRQLSIHSWAAIFTGTHHRSVLTPCFFLTLSYFLAIFPSLMFSNLAFRQNHISPRQKDPQLGMKILL